MPKSHVTGTATPMQSTVPESMPHPPAAPSANPDPRGVRHVIDAKHEAFRRYTLIGKDDEAVSRTAGELLEGSKLLTNRQLLTANLTAVFKKVQDWCGLHHASLSAALVAIRSGKVSLFFIASAPRYDLALDEAMTNLEVELGGSAGVGAVESFQIPERSIEQFVDDNAVLLWQRNDA